MPSEVLAQMRAICLALPEVDEIDTGAGKVYAVRRRRFANVVAMDDQRGNAICIVGCHADPEEREFLLHQGHPYFSARNGRDRIGIVVDDATDWTEMAELLTESYRIIAPKHLVAALDGCR